MLGLRDGNKVLCACFVPGPNKTKIKQNQSIMP